MQSLWTRPALVRATMASLARQCQCPPAFQKTNYSNYRYLSIAADPQLVNMKNKAQAIVERTPIGEIDVDTWLEAKLLLRWWVSQRTPQSVKISFLLLDRLVTEQQTVSTGGYSDVSSFLNTKVIYQLVLNWNQVFKQSAENVKAVLSPQKLLFELDKLCAKSPSLRTTGTMLSGILDATLHLCKQVKSIEVAEFCEVLWDRKVQIFDRSTDFVPIVGFTSVLSAWGACGRPDRAQAFLDRVPHNVVIPDYRSYTIVLSAYAKVGDGTAAELLLERMIRQWQTDVVTWTTVISAWARSSSPDAASRVRALLTRMNDPSNAPLIRPNLVTFNTVLTCLSRSSQKDGADQCLRLLQQMKDLYATGKLDCPPDVFSYSIAMHACAKARRPSHAQDLFE
jgi:pentatricopeptide repeat protein